MLAYSIVGGLRYIRETLDEILAAPKLRSNPRTQTGVELVRTTLLDMTEQLRATLPTVELRSCRPVESAEADPVFHVLAKQYRQSDQVDIEGFKDLFRASEYDCDALLGGHRIEQAGEYVTAPLGVDDDCSNWQVLLWFVIAHVSEMVPQVERIVTRLHVDGVGETAEIIARWESTGQWLSALRGTLTNVLSDVQQFDHFTRPSDQQLSTLVDWSMGELKQS